MKHQGRKENKRKSEMKRILYICVICVLMVGCEYTVPLVDKPLEDMDTEAVGLWQRPGNNGVTEDLLVLPMGKQEYLISYPSRSKDAMFARGCLWSNGEFKLIQLNWIGTVQARLPEDNRTYQFASYTLEKDTIKIRLLNSAVISKDLNSTDALVKAITDNKDNPKLFRDEMVFRKVKN